MMERLRIKRGDTPTLRGVCGDENGPVVLTGAQSVTLTARRRDAALPDLSVPVVVGADAGTWSYRLATTDLPASGSYRVTVTARWIDGTQYTFPSQGHDEIIVEDP